MSNVHRMDSLHRSHCGLYMGWTLDRTELGSIWDQRRAWIGLELNYFHHMGLTIWNWIASSHLPFICQWKGLLQKKFPMLKKICSLSPISFCPGLWVPLADQGETSMVPNCRTQVINRSTQLICIFDFYLSTYKCKIHSIVPNCRAQVDSRFSLHWMQ